MKNCWEYWNCKGKENCKAYPDYGHECWKVVGSMGNGSCKRLSCNSEADCLIKCPWYLKSYGFEINDY